MEAIQDQVILEHFATETKPKSSLEASMLADDYLQATEGIHTGPQNTFKRGSPLKCFVCGILRYMMEDFQLDPEKPCSTKDTENPK